jgi:hypothetical protein
LVKDLELFVESLSSESRKNTHVLMYV